MKATNLLKLYMNCNFSRRITETLTMLAPMLGLDKYFTVHRHDIVAYSRARACCACSRCGTGELYCFYIFHLSSLSNVLSFGRRLNMNEILWFRQLNPKVVVSYCRGRHRLVLVNRLEGLSPPRNSALLADRLDMTSLLTGP